MTNFKFDEKSIKDKISYAEMLLNSNNLSAIERERVQRSLIAYYGILDSIGNVYNSTIQPFLDKITRGKYSANKDSDRLCRTGEIVLNKESYGVLSKEYLQVLVNMASMIQKPQVSATKFGSMQFTDENLRNIAMTFYGNLDPELGQVASSIISIPGLINVSDYRRTKRVDGTTWYDYINNTPYVNVSRAGTIEDAQVFCHELMHANDFVMQPKYFDSNYYGFHETPTYCGDLLFADFMEANGIDENEVNNIRSERIDYICGLAYQSLFQIRSKIGRETFMSGDIDAMYSALDKDILKDLLEVQSGVMAIGLYNQICQNKEYGISNLKGFMKTLIPKEQIPDFSHLGLGYGTLMNICENIKLHGYDFSSYESQNEISQRKTH